MLLIDSDEDDSHAHFVSLFLFSKHSDYSVHSIKKILAQFNFTHFTLLVLFYLFRLFYFCFTNCSIRIFPHSCLFLFLSIHLPLCLLVWLPNFMSVRLSVSFSPSSSGSAAHTTTSAAVGTHRRLIYSHLISISIFT